MQLVVKSKERKKSQLGLSPPRGATHLYVACVQINNTSLYFSRYDTETQWFLDSQFEHGWVPVFNHGEGSRCCTKKVATGVLRNALEEAPFDIESGIK